MIMQNNYDKTHSDYEPGCWNCQKAQRIESYRTVFVPCELFIENKLCEFSPYVRIRCEDCGNFDTNCGCLYGVSPGDSRCFFTPAYNIPKKDKFEPANLILGASRMMTKERPESEWPHNKIICPLHQTTIKCPGNSDSFSTEFHPCKDCPINWSKLRIYFEIKEPEEKDCEDNYSNPGGW
jgi:hypothetical protein